MGVKELREFVVPARGTAVTIGAYDGVHAGHRALIDRLRDRAAERRLASVVLTFDRHPASVVRPESAPKLLCDLEQKLELLEATGVDHVVVVPFDEARSQEEASGFVTGVLVRRLAARLVAVGEDFHFGRQRRGNVELLREMGEVLGFEVEHIDLVAGPGLEGPVSSTAIRRLLADGRVDEAAALLGRHHEVRGRIEAGDGRGRALGYPTANVAVPDDILLPAPGIYAGWCQLPDDGLLRPAAISLGVRPTFGDGPGPLVLEAFLLDFEGDLYDRPVRVRFVSRLRDELRFESAAALAEQIGRDVATTRSLLAGPAG